MAPLKKITMERMRTTHDFRLQVNCDKKLVAFLYYAIVEYYGERTAEVLRNVYSKPAVEKLRAEFSGMVVSDPAFAVFLMRFIRDFVEPGPLSEYARKLYKELGWSEDAGGLL